MNLETIVDGTSERTVIRTLPFHLFVIRVLLAPVNYYVLKDINLSELTEICLN